YFGAQLRMGVPPTSTTVLNFMRRLIDPADARSSLHGMRTAFRSWAGAQRSDDGRRRFDESDMELAIGHVKGHGKTPVSRLYSRQDRDVEPLIPIFNGWADFCFGLNPPAEITSPPQL